MSPPRPTNGSARICTTPFTRASPPSPSSLAGWLLSNDSIIFIHRAEDAEKKEAAIVLAILLPLAGDLQFMLLRRLHAQLPPHPTIVGNKNLHLMALGMLLLLIVIWCVVADVITIPAQFTLKK